jgi:hypothetical protein
LLKSYLDLIKDRYFPNTIQLINNKKELSQIAHDLAEFADATCEDAKKQLQDWWKDISK